MLEPLEFRKTLRLWACGVTVVTTVADGVRAGVTASSFTSVTLEPLLILVCLHKNTQTAQLIGQSGVFSVSILGAGQQEISNQFAGYTDLPEGADRFYELETFTHSTGVPMLREAIAWLECKVHAISDGGTHDIILGEVIATDRKDDALPLVYHNQAYRTVSEPL